MFAQNAPSVIIDVTTRKITHSRPLLHLERRRLLLPLPARLHRHARHGRAVRVLGAAREQPREVALELGGRATLERIAAAGLPPGPYLREELGRVARRLAGLGDPDLAARFAAHEDAATAWVGVAAGGADPARFADDPRRVELVRDGSVLLGELIAELGE